MSSVYCAICGVDISTRYVMGEREQGKYYDLCPKCGRWLKQTWNYWDGRGPHQRGES